VLYLYNNLSSKDKNKPYFNGFYNIPITTKKMIKINFNIIKAFFLFGLIMILQSCSVLKKDKNEENDQQTKKKNVEFNSAKRAEDYASSQGGLIFGGGKSKFGNTNAMWKATLEVLSDIPLSNLDYTSGTIISDWYSADVSSGESIKITVRFTSDKISPNSFDVISFKKKCRSNNCKTTKISGNFNQKIKDSILKQTKLIKQKK